MSCMYCDAHNETRNKILIEVGTLAHGSTLFILKNQNHLGRIVVALPVHRQEVYELTEDERSNFFADVADAAQACAELFHPDKLNYGIFGDGVPHVHMHIVPKYKDGLQWGHFFWDKGLEEVSLSDKEYAKMVNDYKAKLGIK